MIFEKRILESDLLFSIPLISRKNWGYDSANINSNMSEHTGQKVSLPDEDGTES